MRNNKNLFNIINSSDEKKIEYVNNYNAYNIDKYDLVNIIASINNNSYKLDILKNIDKYDFLFHQIISIVDSIDDDAIKETVVKNYKLYGLKQVDLPLIIQSMSDSAIKNIVSNHLDYDLTSKDIAYIVSLINDNEFKKKIINSFDNYYFNNDDLTVVVASVNDDDYKEQFISKNYYTFDSNQIAFILSSIKNDKYKFDIILNYKKYNLTSDDIALILNSFYELDDYLFDILENYKNYGFDNEILASVICLIFNDNKKEKIIMDNDYAFSPALICKIVLSIKDNDQRNSIMDTLYKKGLLGDLNTNKNILLSDDMTFGIEIETEGKYSELVKKEILPEGWYDIIDSTLNRGIEVVSPILRNGDEEQIVKVCALLNSFEQEATRNCAAHVHIGSSYFKNDVNCFKNLIEICANCERILYLISNEEGDVPRNRIFKYAAPITVKINKIKDDDTIDFYHINDMDSFSKKIKLVQKYKFSSINFRNIGLVNKDTIEFRTANGTTSPDVWIDNINLFGSLMYVAKNVTDIQNKPFDKLTDAEKINFYFFKKLTDVSINDRSRLSILLNLFPNYIDKKVYLNRYDVNSELIKGLETDDVLNAISGLRPICISRCSDELKEKIVNNYERYINMKVVNKTR